MKKISLLVLMICGGGLVTALPLGNPTEASLYWQGAWLSSCDSFWSVRMGFYGDYDYNRYMQVQGGGEIATTGRFTNAGLIVLNLWNRLDCFTTLGSTNFSFFGDPHAFPEAVTPSDEIRLFFKPDFSWSMGARATLWEWSALGIGIEAEYFRFNPSCARLLDMSNALSFPLENHSATYSEWQVGLGASYNFSTACSTIGVVPYMGVTLSRARLSMNDLLVDTIPIEIVLSNLQSSKRWAYAIGTTLLLRDSVGLTIEGRFAGEKALHVNGQIRF